MAIFWEHLKYHEDTTEKRALTEEDRDFLVRLQRELNTQDTCGNAEPRYWGIRGTEQIYGMEEGYGDEYDLYDNAACSIAASSMTDAVKIVREFVNDMDDECDWMVEACDGCINVVTYEDGEETLYDLKDVKEWLNEHGGDYSISGRKEFGKIYEDAMFLTQKAAEEHLRKNAHHYADDARTYAMTSWRSPEYERVIEILRHIDWERI